MPIKENHTHKCQQQYYANFFIGHKTWRTRESEREEDGEKKEQEEEKLNGAE